MSYIPENALIVQRDRSVLLEVHSPKAEAALEAIAPFTELIKSPEHIHTYRITALSIWNARAAGLPIENIINALHSHAKYPVPEAVVSEIDALGRRYGLTVIERSPDGCSLLLRVSDGDKPPQATTRPLFRTPCKRRTSCTVTGEAA